MRMVSPTLYPAFLTVCSSTTTSPGPAGARPEVIVKLPPVCQEAPICGGP